ncbi:Flavin-dependent oxidoreductase, luciferase family (includes alkanesulfonate monooxygenase SsuD and methylene tetrahydromethanopterin reductase) [Pseudonocardia ammonioxydans]|uniref:Flavin-dependent oxidoreductase, luciferase family (Includes alkanesulfonate monooxygenase SsuD and methylene tetrahydromethanopterin reductase) n=1 Tax=Pseudonocardia ammonioxydans TaxID=260086 RepID=A0A1I5C3H1_PSUAM|nr:LLM class flavin-dependent oxidoreductase [Pseudonocardia ammonioxydans]SFN81477.1 Flavin-dependent oxidoreductase, luciferase family (includes alkanesulfonate monooxygenase SsuD and methylene tetrahydromethanopterin reductase) [Pseudonocardia ammonioxydans]
MSGRLHLAVELGAAGRHPGAWRLPGVDPDRLFGAEHHVDLVRTAARGGLDLVALPDSLLPPSDDPAALPGTLDAVAIAARVAPAVPGIGVVPTVTVTHTEPFHLSKAIATLDFVATGRAGWAPEVSRTRAEADLFGRTGPAGPAALWRETGEVIEVVARLWDSWEDDAEIRDAPTGRFVDREKLHYIDFDGEFFSVKGPSITPRSPQGQPLTVLRGDEPEALPVVGRHADVVRVAADTIAGAAQARDRVRAAVAEAGRDPDRVAVLLDVETLLGPDAAERLGRLDALAPAGADPAPSTLRHVGAPEELAALLRDAVGERAADGFVFVPLALPSGIGEIVDGLLPALGDAVVPAPYDGSLRDRFGLARPANRYAVT